MSLHKSSSFTLRKMYRLHLILDIVLQTVAL